MENETRFALGEGGGDLTPGRDGWVLWRLPHRDLYVVAHVVRADPRLVVDTVLIRVADRSEGVSTTELREIPLGRLTAALTIRSVQDAIDAAWTAPGAPAWATELPSLDELNSLAERIPLRLLEPRRTLRMRIPAGRRKDRAFYAELLDLYDRLKIDSHRPAFDIAEANGIDAARVHHWLQQARDRTAQDFTARTNDADTNKRITRQLRHEQEAERLWQDELARRLDAIGKTWDEYCLEHDRPGTPDPIGAWDDTQRTEFFRQLRELTAQSTDGPRDRSDFKR